MVTLGNVRASQRRWDESLEQHKLALAQYMSTLGPNHFRVAALQTKLGEHMVRLGLIEDARLVANAPPFVPRSMNSHDPNNY